MELNFINPLAEVLVSAVGLLLIGSALALLLVVTTSAVKQIPLGQLFATWKKRLIVGLLGATVLAVIGVLIATPIAFTDAQKSLVKDTYGLELSTSQLALLQWPKETPNQTTIFGDVRLDKNLEIALIWDDGVYRLVESASLDYVELDSLSEDKPDEQEKE